MRTFNDVEYGFGIHFPRVRRLFIYTWLAEHMGIIDTDVHNYFNPYWGWTRAELLEIIYRLRD